MKYATRINSFLRQKNTLLEALDNIGRIEGVDYVDMNYPEHFTEYSHQEIKDSLKKNGLALNMVNLRFRDEFICGAFDSLNKELRDKAVRMCKEAAEVSEEFHGNGIIIWLGYDGFDYSFQKDYVQSWKWIVECFKEVCTSVNCKVSVEYKPYEERKFTMIDSWGAAWKLVNDVNCDNFGFTMDFCHMLMKKENPAYPIALCLDAGKLFGVHLNDGEGSTDDGFIVGTVHPWKILEVFYYLTKYNYSNVVYFDTFPIRENDVRECEMNVRMCHNFEKMIEKAGIERIDEIVASGDGTKAAELMAELLKQ